MHYIYIWNYLYSSIRPTFTSFAVFQSTFLADCLFFFLYELRTKEQRISHRLKKDRQSYKSQMGFAVMKVLAKKKIAARNIQERGRKLPIKLKQTTRVFNSLANRETLIPTVITICAPAALPWRQKNYKFLCLMQLLANISVLLLFPTTSSHED